MRLAKLAPVSVRAPRTAPPLAIEPRTLSAAYERCRQLHARHGRTYYLATLLLPRWKRRHVHALYGFVRYADEIVDDLASTLDGPAKAAALHAWGRRWWTVRPGTWGARAGREGHPGGYPACWAFVAERPGLGALACLHRAVVLNLATEIMKALGHPGRPRLLRRQGAERSRRGERGALVPGTGGGRRRSRRSQVGTTRLRHQGGERAHPP